jgi:hypothetical protein
VDAGADFAGTTGELSVLYGAAADDALPSPPGHLAYAWTQVGGPVNASLFGATALYTTVGFPQSGTYTFRLTASDSDLQGWDEVEATVTGQPVDVPGDGPGPLIGLRQASPNPARSHAMISFRLAAADAHVLLTVHDAAGRRVTVLQDGPLGEGDHSVFWNRRDDRGVPVAAGVYFVLLQTSTARYTTKITALR